VIDLIRRLVGRDTAHESGANPMPVDGRSRRRDVHLAACAVFLEVARIDNEFDERERQHILRIFEDEYGLSSEDLVELSRASEAEIAKSLDLWTFTNVINEHYSNDEKARLVELLWRLVYADGKMDEHENYFMHKLARLLRLTHRDLIDAKLRVLHPQDGPGGG
jgi:uncharacterized tellurite resistance protein B-like protein